ncbi:MAG: sugar ABC transporter ATP-binding protein [Acidimicrobiales bacterium]
MIINKRKSRSEEAGGPDPGGPDPGRAVSGTVTTSASSDALLLEHVSKTFVGVAALRDVTLRIRPGEVHALVGENGAGKSTVIKVASGAVAPDQGRVVIAGQELMKASPAAAQALGLRVIHQERQIALDLTVAENVLLGRLPSRFGVVSPGQMVKRAKEQLHLLGIEVDPRAPASSLSVAEQQLVEMARAVSFAAKIVVMDEATASLHQGEVATLFALVERLRDAGIAVLYVSHHLEEVFRIADVTTVMRDGEVVGSRTVADTSPGELTTLIFGEEVTVKRSALRGASPVERGGEVVIAKDVRYGPLVRGVDLQVHRGEIVAFTGGTGSGATEVARIIAGALRPTGGSLRYSGVKGLSRVSRSRCARAGIGFIPADRKREGLLLHESVSDNFALGRLAISREILVHRRRSKVRARHLVEQLRVRVRNVNDPIVNLSGGNQQKVILGRWLEVQSHLLVFDEPTAGVDIGSRLQLYREFDALTRDGATIIMVSTDYEEIAALADRVYILRDGLIVGELSGEEATPDRLFRVEMGLIDQSEGPS